MVGNSNIKYYVGILQVIITSEYLTFFLLNFLTRKADAKPEKKGIARI